MPTLSLQGIRLGFRRKAHARARRVNHARDWAISFAVLAVGLGVGLSCLPDRPTRGPSAITLIDLVSETGTAAAFAPAVFALRENGAVVRFATAEDTAAGVVRVGFYDPLDPLLAQATEPVSLPADARLLWLLAAPTEREAIRDRATALVNALSADLRTILTSAEFRAFYRDRFQVAFRDAGVAAWTATRDSDAWRDLMRGMEPTMREIMVREVRPVLERRFRGVPAQMLRANALALIDPFTDRAWNMAPVEDALRAALLELRDRGVAERAIAQMLDNPRSAAVPRVFQDAMISHLTRDDTLPRLLAEMLFDERLRPYMAITTTRANDLMRTAPRLLVSLRGGQELNLVAATVIRATIAGRGDRVVVFMNAEQRSALTALDRSAVRLLERKPRT